MRRLLLKSWYIFRCMVAFGKDSMWNKFVFLWKLLVHKITEASPKGSILFWNSEGAEAFHFLRNVLPTLFEKHPCENLKIYRSFWGKTGVFWSTEAPEKARDVCLAVMRSCIHRAQKAWRIEYHSSRCFWQRYRLALLHVVLPFSDNLCLAIWIMSSVLARLTAKFLDFLSWLNRKSNEWFFKKISNFRCSNSEKALDIEFNVCANGII